ncbi:cytochrome c oxidase assembly protein subunit 15 [Georgenia soli]|uniref:Cytochrome c oxidase assembly protein subunit 15 n=1 Tax=Georgenia soli TaxID=638953 RepID=A0A2A9EHE8_9MICO|nr:COX15/CtaA family protein [Georgenia soli]PFG38334.1 cytochrome c oxidase assembly protein subunit 15 [Georgenia soli]
MSTATDPTRRDGRPADLTAPADRVPPSDRAVRVDRLTWGLAVANLVAQIGIIVTGGAVRLTDSGLGCSSWPMCEPGSFTPVFHEATSIHPYIEFGNRTLTGVLSVIAVALLVAVYRREPTASRPARLRRLAWVPLVGIALQAVIGGITVWYDLHPAIVGSHMLISLALVAVSAYLLVRLRSADGPAAALMPSSWRPLPWVLALAAAAVVVLGTVVTGAGPHSGDQEQAFRYAVDPLPVTRAHAASVWVFVAVIAAGAVLLVRRRGDTSLDGARRAWWGLLAVTVLEGVIGYTQYFTGLPEILVGLHMLGAALVVVATTFACSALYARRELAA